MIDFNMAEIVVLAVLAVVIFGPEKLPQLARKSARVLNYLRNIANDAQGRLREELGPEFADLNLADLNPKTLVTKHVLNPVQETLDPLRAELDPVIAELSGSGEDAAMAAVEVEEQAGMPKPSRAPFDSEAT